MHRDAAHRIPTRGVTPDLRKSATEVWDSALEHAGHSGTATRRWTVLAPTGTIGFMMDCDTTGIEPDLPREDQAASWAAARSKIVNQTVPRALAKLGYDEPNRTVILRHLETTGTIEGAPGLKDEHLPVFDCAFKAVSGSRFISHSAPENDGCGTTVPVGRDLEDCQCSRETGPEEIEKLYVEGWKLGLKSAAVYRDNCKGSQPARSGWREGRSFGVPAGAAEAARRARRNHPQVSRSKGKKGTSPSACTRTGSPASCSSRWPRRGSTLSGVMDAFATAISLTLQYGVPLEFLVNKFSHVRFEPAVGPTTPDSLREVDH